jgi:cytochrome c
MKAHSVGMILLAVLLAAGCATTYTPRSNSREELISYVERAADLVRREGAGACTALAQPAWMQGDWYIFVSRVADDVLVCHPQPDMVGQDQTNLRDVNGVYIAREMRARAESPQGRGWVDYMWPRPGQTTPEKKSAYVMAVTGPDGTRYVVGSGTYGM